MARIATGRRARLPYSAWAKQDLALAAQGGR